MERVLVGSLKNFIGNIVKVGGWIETIRDQKKMQFIVLRDHTGSVQAINEKTGLNTEITDVISNLTSESAVEIVGKVIENEVVKLGKLEIAIESINVMAKADAPLPIDKNSSLEMRLDFRFLDIRRPENLIIFKVQTTAEYAMRCFWQERGFLEIHSPKFMETASESGAELFQVDYFGGKAYLAQSPQFYKQMAMAAGLDRIFEIGPVFRANPSFTSRHDTEFTSVDVEISWIESHEDLMRFEESWIRYMLSEVKKLTEKK